MCLLCGCWWWNWQSGRRVSGVATLFVYFGHSAETGNAGGQEQWGWVAALLLCGEHPTQRGRRASTWQFTAEQRHREKDCSSMLRKVHAICSFLFQTCCSTISKSCDSPSADSDSLTLGTQIRCKFVYVPPIHKTYLTDRLLIYCVLTHADLHNIPEPFHTSWKARRLENLENPYGLTVNRKSLARQLKIKSRKAETGLLMSTGSWSLKQWTIALDLASCRPKHPSFLFLPTPYLLGFDMARTTLKTKTREKSEQLPNRIPCAEKKRYAPRLKFCIHSSTSMHRLTAWFQGFAVTQQGKKPNHRLLPHFRWCGLPPCACALHGRHVPRQRETSQQNLHAFANLSVQRMMAHWQPACRHWGAIRTRKSLNREYIYRMWRCLISTLAWCMLLANPSLKTCVWSRRSRKSSIFKAKT